jgi:hypothetical protein
MVDNATLLQQCAGLHSSVAMADNALDLTAVLRCPAARYNSGQRCAAAFLFFFVFFYTRQLEERKRMGEREKF